MNLKTSVSIFTALLVIPGCSSPENRESQKPTITATTSIIADVVRNITGDKVNVISIMGAGVDPHLYKASQGDVQLLQEANMVIYNGLHLEGKMSEVLEKLSHGKTVVAVSDGIDKKFVRTINSDANVYDPHIWFDMKIWREGVQYISGEIQSKFPEIATEVDSCTRNYLHQIDSVQTACEQLIAELDTQKRILITSHDAFEYFGRRFGFTVRGLQGISTLSESGLKDVTDMVNYIITNKVKSVFVENSVPQKALRSVIDGCNAKGWDVKVGGELFSDALGANGTAEGTYLGMVEFNVRTIVKGLK
ncbi:MAG: manganese transporter [Bacteroidetes bacterium]|nr:manganese transporter [Bacteroidota bacterium]